MSEKPGRKLDRQIEADPGSPAPETPSQLLTMRTPPFPAPKRTSVSPETNPTALGQGILQPQEALKLLSSQCYLPRASGPRQGAISSGAWPQTPPRNCVTAPPPNQPTPLRVFGETLVTAPAAPRQSQMRGTPSNLQSEYLLPEAFTSQERVLGVRPKGLESLEASHLPEAPQGRVAAPAGPRPALFSALGWQVPWLPLVFLPWLCSGAANLIGGPE